MTTVNDVAKYAGVSIGTVDRVLHGRGRGSPATEARVREALRALNYRPNIHARNLSQSRTFVFDILSPGPKQRIDGGYWALPLRGVERAVSRLTVNNIKVRNHWFDRHDKSSFRSVLAQMDPPPDGVLVAPVVAQAAQDELVAVLREREIAAVSFDSPFHEAAEIPFVGQSPIEGGMSAGRLSHLYRRAGSTIVSITIGGSDAHLRERAAGFQRYWRKSVPHVTPMQLVLEHGDEASYLADIQSRLRPVLDDLSVVFVTNAASRLFIEAIEGLNYPEHIPLIGYDLVPKNIELMRQGCIDAIISQRPEEQGYEAMNMLVHQVVFGKPAQKEMLMPIEIIIAENLSSFLGTGTGVGP